ncbi:MAG: PepSY domain-containing protein [Rheinheimera sp.]
MNRILAWRRVRLAFGICTILCFWSGAAVADDECQDPIDQWQPREVLKTKLEQQGWVVKRIRIDDGCYEVRAIDAQGRRVKATYAPASLTLLELKVKHDKQDHREH